MNRLTHMKCIAATMHYDHCQFILVDQSKSFINIFESIDINTHIQGSGDFGQTPLEIDRFTGQKLKNCPP